jgi:hypothetical protein
MCSQKSTVTQVGIGCSGREGTRAGGRTGRRGATKLHSSRPFCVVLVSSVRMPNLSEGMRLRPCAAASATRRRYIVHSPPPLGARDSADDGGGNIGQFGQTVAQQNIISGEEDNRRERERHCSRRYSLYLALQQHLLASSSHLLDTAAERRLLLSSTD